MVGNQICEWMDTQHNIVNLPILDTYKKTVGLGTNDIVLAITVACSIYTLPNCILIKQMLRGGGVLGQRIYLVQEQGGWKTFSGRNFKQTPDHTHYVKIWLK